MSEDSSGLRELLEEFDRDLLVQAWQETFDVGGKHHTKTIRDEGSVDWIAYSIQSCARARRSGWAVGALALHRIVSAHAFWDCNHRTGWGVCLTVMATAGYKPCLSGTEVTEFVKSIDRDHLSEERVREWVRRAFVAST